MGFRIVNAYEIIMKIIPKPIIGHIILYCKDHYRVDNVSFIQGLERIWAVRCALDSCNQTSHRYIADELYLILKTINPYRADKIQEIIHEKLTNPVYEYNHLETVIEKLIHIYKFEIWATSVKKWEGGLLIKLPKPKPQLFKRIIRGNVRSGDNILINN